MKFLYTNVQNAHINITELVTFTRFLVRCCMFVNKVITNWKTKILEAFAFTITKSWCDKIQKTFPESKKKFLCLTAGNGIQ
jgi:hypothetical protein